MIFVTVGTQLPFDRLIGAVETWACESQYASVFAQTGPTERDPKHIESARFIDPPEFKRRMAEARVIVGHAGMGTIIGALEIAKPVLVLPRRAELGEHRNDHQLATARRFAGTKGVSVVMDESELGARLTELIENNASQSQPIRPDASPELIEALTRFIHEGKTP